MNIDNLLHHLQLDEIDLKCKRDYESCALIFGSFQTARDFIANAKYQYFNSYLFKKFNVSDYASKFENVQFLGIIKKKLWPEDLYFVYYSNNKLIECYFDHLIIIEKRFNPF